MIAKKITLFYKHIFYILTPALLVLTVSCGNELSEQTEQDTLTDDEAYLSISIGGQQNERTILPESISLSDLTFVLSGVKDGGERIVLRRWATSDTISSAPIRTKAGMWNLTLDAYKQGIHMLTAVQNSIFLYGKDNNVVFYLEGVSETPGSIDVSFVFPVGTAAVPGVKKIVAELVSDATETKADTKTLSPSAYESDNTKEYVRYINNSVPAGYYFLRFYIYQDESSSYTDFYCTYIYVMPFTLSSEKEEITSLSKIYSIKFDLNGGTWSEDAVIPTKFSKFTSLKLPTEATFSNSNWSDAYIVGWYEKRDDGNYADAQIITELPAGTTKDVELCAKWNIVCTDENIEYAFANLPTGRFGIKLSAASNNYSQKKLDDDSKFIDLDFSEMNEDLSWHSSYRDSHSIISINLENVSFIPDDAFFNTNIKELYIPESVQSTGINIFSECRLLETVQISAKITDFDRWFQSCSSLKSVVIPDTVSYIHGDAFEGCTNLTYLYIPVSVKNIEWEIVYNTPNLTHITYGGTKQQFDNILIEQYGTNGFTGKTIVCTDGSFVYSDK